MKRLGMILLALALVFALTGCSAYRSKYRAVGFVHSNTSGESFMDFFEFEGTMVFKMKCDAGQSLAYTGKLETGSVTVSLAQGEEKTEIFSLSGGDELDGSVELPDKGTVYVIVESPEKSENGAFEFRIDG